MKYVIVIPDGAADEPQDSLGGKTPLEAANLPEMDAIARTGILGRSCNVPQRFLPGSDVATLSLFGYDPDKYFTGRAPLEAAAMGLELGPDDWAIRCNTIYCEDGRLTDFTADHITSEESAQLLRLLQEKLGTANIEFHPGVSYRNILIYRGRPGEAPFDATTVTTPPHDKPDEPAIEHLPRGRGSELLRDLMERGSLLVKNHPLNAERVKAGHSPANAIWLWGQGNAPALTRFKELHGLTGAIISAVDLVRGVGMLVGWERIDVPGATGYIDTDYAAKGRAGVEALKTHDLVCVHVEAPDEASHKGWAKEKVEALEQIDRHIVGPMRRALAEQGEGRIVVSPDHATLIRTKAHDRAWVPWAMAGTGLAPSGSAAYNEPAALAANGPYLPDGHRMMADCFLRKSQ